MSATPDFGARIAGRRRELSINQSDFARRIKVSRMTVHAWETGRALPDLRHLVRIMEVLEWVWFDKLARISADAALAVAERERAEAALARVESIRSASVVLAVSCRSVARKLAELGDRAFEVGCHDLGGELKRQADVLGVAIGAVAGRNQGSEYDGHGESEERWREPEGFQAGVEPDQGRQGIPPAPR